MRSKIRKTLKNAFGKVYVNHHESMVSLLKNTSTYTAKPNLVFLVPPTTAGSLGDEAMVVGAYKKLIEDGKECIIVSGDVNGNKRLKLYGIKPIEIGVKGLYDGFLGIKRFQKVLLQLQPESVYLIGADVMDGFYSPVRSINRLTILKLSSNFCKDVRLLGFSFNAEPLPKVLSFFKKCSGAFNIQPRDPVSSHRLSSHQIENRCVADLAFLLPPDESLVSSLSQKKFVCINLNAIHLKKWGAEFFELAFGIVQHLIKNTEFDIVFVSHDFRKFEGISDHDFSVMVAKKLNIENDERVTFVDEYATASQLKGIVSKAYFAVTGRMHFAIAALGNAIPTIMVGYQGKQEGLAQHFSLDVNSTVIAPTASVNQASSIIDEINTNRDEINTLLKSKLPIVKELSLSNIR